MLMIASPLIEPAPIPLRLALSIRKIEVTAGSGEIAAKIEKRLATPPIVPPLVLSIAALREPTVEMLVALTFIAASAPIIPPLELLIVKLVSLCVASWPLRLNARLALPPMVPPPKLSDSSGERPAGGNVGSTYTDYGIRTNCSTTVATACVVVRNFEQPGALRTDIAADTDVNDRIAVDRTAADPVTVSVVYSEARVTAGSGEIAAKIEKEVGHPADRATAAVVDRGIKSAPVETLFAVTLITASDPIVPPGSFEDQKGRVAHRGEIAADIKAEVRAPDDVRRAMLSI